MRRRLTILMCADLVGYSALMGRDEALAVKSVQELKRERLEPVAANHGGEVLKRMGDGWILSFPGVEAALNCAEEVQSALVDHDTIKLRIGCHIGEIVEDDDDFYGAGVNIAQRIETEAPPGGLMMSEDLFRQLSEARQKELSDAGVFRLKNIAAPMRLYQWRPANLVTAPDAGALPSIGFDAVTCAPDTEDARAVAEDIHDGLIQHSMKRTGVKTVNTAADPRTPTVFLVRGRLRMAGSRGRFNLSLILREDMSTIWSGTYEGDTTDVFAFTDDILRRAEVDIRMQTIRHDGDRLAHLKDDQLSVSELRARSAQLFFNQDIDSWKRGLAALDRAVALSPRDPMALAMRAQQLLNRWSIEFADPDPALQASLARDFDFAVEEMPHSDYVFWARGGFRFRMLGDVAAAKFDVARSLEINPGFLGVIELQAAIALFEKRFDEAREYLAGYTLSATEDPFKVFRLAFATRLELCAGDFERAAQLATEAAYLNPGDRGLHLLRALACDKAGDTTGRDASRNAAAAIEKGPSVTMQRLRLPDAFQWVNDATHPMADPV
ncbi:adenylate/guanylate cyclase domain-containing protein [Shimia biformata]|uniref:adenylate/guanylate cyclase domain-containing protein n=1 Tax=Shimia biformata TaxID=1294299 RepID=UPI001951184E|nr:adenylate/guanylate cyclase domain-containing protein [Shimia biformata]